jgi:hypothetical protein
MENGEAGTRRKGDKETGETEKRGAELTISKCEFRIAKRGIMIVSGGWND